MVGAGLEGLALAAREDASGEDFVHGHGAAGEEEGGEEDGGEGHVAIHFE